MVTPAMNLLAALNATKPAANSNNTPSATQSNKESGRKFARLVDESTSKNDPAPKAKPRNVSTEGATQGQSALSTKPLSHDITATEAAEVLAQLNNLAQQTKLSAADAALLAAVKDKLQNIVDTNIPASFSDMLGSLSEEQVQQVAALLPSAQAAHAAEKKVPVLTKGEFIATAQQVLHLINNALENAPVAEDAALLPADTAPVTLVPAVATLVQSNDSAEEELPVAEAAQPTVTTITPLANLLLVAQPATAPAPAQPTTTNAVAAPVEAVSAVDVSSTKSVSLDTLIPPLALTAEEKKQPLPEVSLPKIGGAEKLSAVKNEPEKPVTAPTLPAAIARQMEALNDSQQLFAAGLAKEDAAAVKAANANTPAVNTAAIAHTGAVETLTGANAVTAVGAIGTNLINHAPIREQVHVAIAKASKEGVDQITIQLDPLGLGRVEVKMQVAQDGKTSLAFLVDKPETFDALSRDARGLERSLQESGLKADSGGMQFNLRQQPQMHSDMGGDRSGTSGRQEASVQPSAAVAATPATPTRNYRVDIRDGIDIHA